MRIVPGEVKTSVLHQYLLGAIAPRPICFASTMDAEGRPNLSPYSFFNVFGSNPTTLVFSPSRKVRDNTIKHTLENAEATGEVVINTVSYAMVQQMSLSSCEYPRGVDEFEKAGFGKIASEIVQPFRVAESAVQMECKVRDIIKTGMHGGAGNLVICEVLLMHINDGVLNSEQQIDPHKIDLVARMGFDNYCRASGNAVFTVPKPHASLGIGFDGLPQSVLQSKVLTGNHLGMLANVSEIPEPQPSFSDERTTQIMQYFAGNPDELDREMHLYAARLLDESDIAKAWQVLLMTV